MICFNHSFIRFFISSLKTNLPEEDDGDDAKDGQVVRAHSHFVCLGSDDAGEQD